MHRQEPDRPSARHGDIHAPAQIGVTKGQGAEVGVASPGHALADGKAHRLVLDVETRLTSASAARPAGRTRRNDDVILCRVEHPLGGGPVLHLLEGDHVGVQGIGMTAQTGVVRPGAWAAALPVPFGQMLHIPAGDLERPFGLRRRHAGAGRQENGGAPTGLPHALRFAPMCACVDPQSGGRKADGWPLLQLSPSIPEAFKESDDEPVRPFANAVDQKGAAASDGAPGGQHHLGNGAAWRVPPPVRALATLYRMGPGRGRGLAHGTAGCADPPGAASRCAQTHLPSVRVEAHLVQQGRGRPAQVVHGEGLERQVLLPGALRDSHGHPVEGRPGHGRVGVVARRQDVAGVSRTGLQGDQDVEHLGRQIDVVGARALHPFLGDGPDSVLKIHLVPGPVLELALAHHAQQNELQAKPDGRQGRDISEQPKHDPDLGGRERPITGSEARDRCRRHSVGRIVDLLAVEDGPGVDLLDDVPDMDGRGGRAPLHDGLAMGAQVVRRDLGEQPVAPLRQDLPVEDGPPHVARAVRHGRGVHPLLRHMREVPRLLQATLGPLLFKCGRYAFGDHPLRIDELLAGFGERQACRPVGPESDRLAPPIETVVVLERDAS
uniref:LigA n=1 Tax=Parastrongyloides trichosuri TaxID=131310 RepID=A0A0N4ZGT4_PARTI